MAFLKKVAKAVVGELDAAMKQHDKEYPDGDWESANKRIGSARTIGDSIISAARMWPRESKKIGNDVALGLLRRCAEGAEGEGTFGPY